MNFNRIEELIKYLKENNLYEETLKKTRFIRTLSSDYRTEGIEGTADFKVIYESFEEVYVGDKRIEAKISTYTYHTEYAKSNIEDDRILYPYEFDEYLKNNKDFLEAVLALNKNKYSSYQSEITTGKLISINDEIINEQPRVVLTCETRELINNDYYNEYYDYKLTIDGKEVWNRKSYDKIKIEKDYNGDYKLFREIEYVPSSRQVNVGFGEIEKWIELIVKIVADRVSVYDGQKYLYPENKYNNDKKIITDKLDLKETIREILTSEKSLDLDSISLYDVAQLIHDNYRYTGYGWTTYWRSQLGYSYQIIQQDDGVFIYDDMDVCVNAKFGKTQDGELYIKSQTGDFGDKLLKSSGTIILKAIDDIKNITLEDVSDYTTNSSNSDLKLHFNGNRIVLGAAAYDSNNPEDFKKFTIHFSGSYNKYKSYSDYGYSIDDLKGKEEKIFKHIFIRIDDCPKWTRPLLLEIRKKQLQPKKEKLLSSLKNLKNSITNDFTSEDSNNKTR